MIFKTSKNKESKNSLKQSIYSREDWNKLTSPSLISNSKDKTECKKLSENRLISLYRPPSPKVIILQTNQWTKELKNKSR
jgi:hypothetical protein